MTNAYPASLSISDANVNCFGYANLHVWHFSSDFGVTETQFNNADIFHFCATLFLSGSSGGEAGLQLAPWWSHYADGSFNVRSTSECKSKAIVLSRVRCAKFAGQRHMPAQRRVP